MSKNLKIHFRIATDAVPEELMVLDPLPEEQKFPRSMADDVIPLEFQIDIDRRPNPPNPPPPEDNPEAGQIQIQDD